MGYLWLSKVNFIMLHQFFLLVLLKTRLFSFVMLCCWHWATEAKSNIEEYIENVQTANVTLIATLGNYNIVDMPHQVFELENKTFDISNGSKFKGTKRRSKAELKCAFNYRKDFLKFSERDVIWRNLQKQREGLLKHLSCRFTLGN